MTGLPSYNDIMIALSQYLHDINGATLPREAYRSLAQNFGLTDEQLAFRRADGRGSAWENRVQWARRKLVDVGVMDRGAVGVWCLDPRYQGGPL